MEKEMIIANIVDTIEEAHVCIDAALRFATYIMEDGTERKLPDLEGELRDTKKWMADSVKYVALLKERLEEEKDEKCN